MKYKKNQRCMDKFVFAVRNETIFLHRNGKSSAKLLTPKMLLRFLVILCVLWTVSASAAFCLELVLASDPWCPYTCDPDSPDPGYLVEVSRAIFTQHDIRIHYQTKPWKRVLVEAKSGIIDGAMTVDKSDGAGLVLNKIPFTTTIQTVVTRKNDPFQWKGIDSVSYRVFIAINGYTYGEAINGWIRSDRRTARIHLVSGEDALPRSLRMIFEKRGDFLVNDLNVLKHTLSSMSLAGKFQFQPTGLQSGMFIGFSGKRKDAEKLADYLDSGMASPKMQPLIRQLKEKYHIN